MLSRRYRRALIVLSICYQSMRSLYGINVRPLRVPLHMLSKPAIHITNTLFSLILLMRYFDAITTLSILQYVM